MIEEPSFITSVANRGREIAVTVLDAAGDRVSIPEATDIAFSLWDPMGTVVADNQPADNDQTDADPETWGDLSYTFAEDDLATPGLYYGAFTIGAGAEAWTFPTDRPLTIVVRPNPAGIS